MIPKTIHYCWFGRQTKPTLVKKCLHSWKKYCPDFRIIEWNEDNIDIAQCPRYVRQAYRAKRWAFVADYIRLKVVAENGGIYLDTDVELVKDLSPLLHYRAFFASEDAKSISTGLGFGAEKEHLFVQTMCNAYNDISFIQEDGKLNLTPCPGFNTQSLGALLPEGKLFDTITDLPKGVVIFPPEYFNPLDYFSTHPNITRNTYAIHWYAASWNTELQSKLKKEKIKRILLGPIIILMRTILGPQRYDQLKRAVCK